MLQVVEGILLHSYMVVGSSATLLDFFRIQILLCLILLLCTQRDLHVVYCIEVLDYTVWGYIGDAQCYTTTACFYTTVTQYYTTVVPD
jgi:hypothetical protein